MSRRAILLGYFFLPALLLISRGRANAASIEALDFTPHAVNSDGSIVVGYSYSLREASRWTAESGLVGLGTLPGKDSSRAFDVSADGLVVVGSSGGEAFRWTAQPGMVGLGFLYPAESLGSYALGASADGSVVVGYDRYVRFGGTFSEAFRWTAESGMVGLGKLPGHGWSQAYGVSADGSVVVGSSVEAFRWTPEGGMVGLGALSFGSSVARAVSADGSVVVGRSNREGFRWTAENGMIGLGGLGLGLPPSDESEAYGASADGSLVVGSALYAGTRPGAEPVAAWIWDETHGTRELKNVLTDDFGLDLSDWNLLAANDISDDGRVIVGWGWYTPPGEPRIPLGYRAVIPEPSTCGLLCCALLSLLTYARVPRTRRG